MIYIGEETKKAFLEVPIKNLRLIFDDGTKLDNDDIYYESLRIEQTLCDQDELRFGKVCAASLNVRIVATTKKYKGLKFDAIIECDGHELRLGSYKIESEQRTSDRMYKDIVAYDALYEVMNNDYKDWYNSLDFSSLTVRSMRELFFAFCGIEQEPIRLVNDSMRVEKTVDAETLSGLAILESISEINGCFGTIGVNGKFKWVSIVNSRDALYPDDELYPGDDIFPKDIVNIRLDKSDYYLGSLVYEDYKTHRITQLQIRQEDEDIGVTVGKEGNCYIVQNNFLVFGKTKEELEIIGNNLLRTIDNVIYTPLKVSCKSMPWVELGDYIQINATVNTVETPILKRVITGINALSDEYSARGSEYYKEKVNGPQNQIKQLRGRYHLLKVDLDETKSKIGRVEEGQTLESMIRQSATTIESRVDSIVTNLQNQINGNINTYSTTTKPTLSNYPASQWDKTTYMNHIGDICYHTYTIDGEKQTDSYKFLYDESNDKYYWELLGNTDVTKAIADAEEALEIANGVKKDLSANYRSTSQIASDITQESGLISQAIKAKYVTSVDISDKNGKLLGNYSTTTEMNTAITQKFDEITLSVSKSYETITNAKATKKDLESKILLNERNINLKVSKDDLINQINVSTDEIKIQGNRFVLDANNCKIDKYGNLSAKNAQFEGTVTSVAGKEKTVVKDGSVWFYNDGIESGHIINSYIGSVKGLKVYSVNGFVALNGGSSAHIEISSNSATGWNGVYVAGNLYSKNQTWMEGTQYNYSDGLWYNFRPGINVSDIRLKENIKSAENTNALDYIEKIEFKSFDWKRNKTHEELGIIAQQVMEVIPHSTIENKQPDGSENDSIYTLNEHTLLMYSMKAIKELKHEIDELRKGNENG